VTPISYDEFSFFREIATEYGLPFDDPPVVRRTTVEVEPGLRISSLQWGRGASELVFLHGGAQNAHTWDTVAMALDRPLLAIDLPGHGHSDEGRSGSRSIEDGTADIATVIQRLAPNARAIVGMSLGGLSALYLYEQFPDLVRRLVLVDITPGVTRTKGSAIADFVNGPETFASFDDLLARTIAYNPGRTVSSLRRGILHNAVQRSDGSWVWRYARARSGAHSPPVDRSDLWSVVSTLAVPVMLVRGTSPQSLVDDADEAEFRRRSPTARVEHVEGAGHSVQGDKPLELAALIADFSR
jgi:pimeloyl-ACP methyl ester carboxylesterase